MSNNISPISRALIFMDNVCDYIPFVSTVTNLIDILQKAVFKGVSAVSSTAEKDLKTSHYCKHIRDDKSTLVCLGLLVPGVNILVKTFSSKTDDIPKPMGPNDRLKDWSDNTQFLKDDYKYENTWKEWGNKDEFLLMEFAANGCAYPKLILYMTKEHGLDARKVMTTINEKIDVNKSSLTPKEILKIL